MHWRTVLHQYVSANACCDRKLRLRSSVFVVVLAAASPPGSKLLHLYPPHPQHVTGVGAGDAGAGPSASRAERQAGKKAARKEAKKEAKKEARREGHRRYAAKLQHMDM
jgi:hypothetical protein